MALLFAAFTAVVADEVSDTINGAQSRKLRYCQFNAKYRLARIGCLFYLLWLHRAAKIDLELLLQFELFVDYFNLLVHGKLRNNSGTH